MFDALTIRLFTALTIKIISYMNARSEIVWVAGIVDCIDSEEIKVKLASAGFELTMIKSWNKYRKVSLPGTLTILAIHRPLNNKYNDF